MSASGLRQRRPRASTASVVGVVAACVQGLALIANGLVVAFVVLSEGITGPSAVASPAGVTVEVLLYLGFGAALLWIGRGLLRGSPYALTPFALAQLLGLTVAIPMAQGNGTAALIGVLATALCLTGLAAWALLLHGQLAQDRRS